MTWRCKLSPQFEDLTASSMISDFYYFIGFYFRILILISFLLEEEGRFSPSALGLRAPALGRALRFSCAESR